jgi:hypothetical protein
MPTDRERAVAAAVAQAPRGADLTIIDGRTGRAAAHRPGSGPEPEAALLVVGPLDLGALGARRPAIRPSRRDGGASGEPAEPPWLSPADRRRFRRERNRHAHAFRTARAQAAPGAHVDAARRPGGARAARRKAGGARRADAPRSEGDLTWPRWWSSTTSS